MSYTTNIANAFDLVNSKIRDLTDGKSQLCDYDSFQSILEAWIVPDYIDPIDVDSYIFDFNGYLQYRFEDELEDIMVELKLISQHIKENEQKYLYMSSREVLSEINGISSAFQYLCECSLQNIRLQLNEQENFMNLEIESMTH